MLPTQLQRGAVKKFQFCDCAIVDPDSSEEGLQLPGAFLCGASILLLCHVFVSGYFRAIQFFTENLLEIALISRGLLHSPVVSNENVDMPTKTFKTIPRAVVKLLKYNAKQEVKVVFFHVLVAAIILFLESFTQVLSSSFTIYSPSSSETRTWRVNNNSLKISFHLPCELQVIVSNCLPLNQSQEIFVAAIFVTDFTSTSLEINIFVTQLVVAS